MIDEAAQNANTEAKSTREPAARMKTTAHTPELY